MPEAKGARREGGLSPNGVRRAAAPEAAVFHEARAIRREEGVAKIRRKTYFMAYSEAAP